ncbi:MAG: response regulator [Cyanobacteria bacterium P01_G01_bin.49]
MKKILVIEDELSVRENLVDLLEAEDYQVFSTENGILAILWAQDNIPDLVICDVMMPEINGYEVLEELRSLPMTASVPFIFLTAMADKTDFRQGMELGADDYLTKPFTREEMLSAIKSRLSRHEIVMEQYNSEHMRVKALEKQVQKLQQREQWQDLDEKSQEALLKVNTAMNLLQKLESEHSRDRSLSVLQELCGEEIALFQKIPNLHLFLTPEQSNLLRQAM